MLSDCFDRFLVDRSKVHMILRDAANSMNHATELLDEDSFDCFAHKLHLVQKHLFSWYIWYGLGRQ